MRAEAPAQDEQRDDDHTRTDELRWSGEVAERRNAAIAEDARAPITAAAAVGALRGAAQAPGVVSLRDGHSEAEYLASTPRSIDLTVQACTRCDQLLRRAAHSLARRSRRSYYENVRTKLFS
jgi:hypothetical protein